MARLNSGGAARPATFRGGAFGYVDLQNAHVGTLLDRFGPVPGEASRRGGKYRLAGFTVDFQPLLSLLSRLRLVAGEAAQRGRKYRLQGLHLRRFRPRDGA